MTTTQTSSPTARPLVALDVDGTILHHDEHLSPAVRDAVRSLADRAHVVIATGRSIVAALPVLATLGLTHGYAVCSNGALTLELDAAEAQGYRILRKVTFDPAPMVRALLAEYPSATVAVEEVGVGYKVSKPFPHGELVGEETVVPMDELLAHPVTRVTLRCAESTAEDFMALAERVGMTGVSYAVGFTAWMDINPDGVSKASALEEVRGLLGVPPEATVAVGDQRNDLEMLRWAARGVAMGQAPDEVKTAADEVTGTVEEDGLVPVLESIGTGSIRVGSLGADSIGTDSIGADSIGTDSIGTDSIGAVPADRDRS